MSSSASPGGEMATRSSDRPMRERIVAAAIQVIRERGVTRATTKEIARAAKVSEGSIYNHFENKTALFGAAFGAVTSGIRGAMRELAASVGKGTVEGNLERLAGAAVRFYGELLPMTASALADHQVSAWLRQRMPERGGGPVQGHAALIAYLEAERAARRLPPARVPVAAGRPRRPGRRRPAPRRRRVRPRRGPDRPGRQPARCGPPLTRRRGTAG